MKSKIILSLFMLVTLNAVARSIDGYPLLRFSNDTSFRFEIGVGGGFRGPHFFYNSHVYVEKSRVIFGLRAGRTFRSYAGRLYYSPGESYDSWYRVSDASLIMGFRLWKKVRLNAVGFAGPSVQLKNYKQWGVNGMGMVPFLWSLMLPVAGRDASDLGFTAGLDLRAQDKYLRHQFNFMVFGSFYQGESWLGATIDFSMGKLY